MGEMSRSDKGGRPPSGVSPLNSLLLTFLLTRKVRPLGVRGLWLMGGRSCKNMMKKMRSRILEFEEQQKLLVEIVNVFRNSINDIKKQKGDSSNG